MKRSMLAVTIASLGVTFARADQGLTGTWKLRVSFGGREGRVSILKFQQQGDKLNGVMLRHQGSRTSLENVSFQDGKVAFDVLREWNGRRFSSRYVGTLAEDEIKGTTQYQRRGETRTLNWTATRTTDEQLARELDTPPVAADIDLTEENYQQWRDHILPEVEELAWQQIPWLTTFKDGIRAANKEGKPLLLWTMNGHPLGCT